MNGYLIAIGGFFLTLMSVFYKGKKAGKEQEQYKQLKANNETKKRMRKASTISSNAELSRVLKSHKF